MKKQVCEDQFSDSVFLLQPSKPILCTTKNDDGTDHVATFGWVNPVSNKPPRIALALLNNPKKQHSLENIERTGEFVINVPDIKLAKAIVMASYRVKFGENKFDRSGLTRLPSVKVAPPSIEECRAHLECKMINSLDTGDHTLIIADIAYARYDEEAFTQSFLINMDQYTPAIHLQSFNLNDSQVHIFMAPCGTYATEVPYPKREDIKDFEQNTILDK